MEHLAIKLPEPLGYLLPIGLQALCISSPCARGDLLFKQGRRPRHMFFVASGEVILQRLGMRGETVVLQRTRRGFIGEASLQSMRYHCDAVVKISGEVIAMPIDAIAQTLRTDSEFAARWIAMLSQEVRRLRTQCERLSMGGVKQRLLHLIQTEGIAGRLPIGAGLKSMAAELGVTHEALYRAVADLEKTGILCRRENFLLVPGMA